MYIVILGAGGQLGSALVKHFADRPNTRLDAWDLPTHDISHPDISGQIAACRPDVVINAAAMTNVDAAEERQEQTYAVNALGPAYLAEGCARCNALLLHVSTNEVFAGEPGVFYREYDATAIAMASKGIYARSKLAGERAVLLHHSRTIVARVAWLFGPGGQNFPTKITAAADVHGALRVVDDEFGNPTYAPDAAVAMARLIELARPGIYHVVNQGHTSRFELAQTVLAAGGRSHVSLTPIPSAEWPRPTPPPLHAVLVNQTAAALGVTLRPWQEAVQEYVQLAIVN
jgi:dTDP-4-dehydrorhamnose reductase